MFLWGILSNYSLTSRMWSLNPLAIAGVAPFSLSCCRAKYTHAAKIVCTAAKCFRQLLWPALVAGFFMRGRIASMLARMALWAFIYLLAIAGSLILRRKLPKEHPIQLIAYVVLRLMRLAGFMLVGFFLGLFIFDPLWLTPHEFSDKTLNDAVNGLLAGLLGAAFGVFADLFLQLLLINIPKSKQSGPE
jgi:hypothetical protein